MCRSRRAFFFVLPDKYCFKFREFQNPETLALQWFANYRLVGLRLLVGVIRRSNGKPLRPSRFVDYAQFKTETMEKPRAVALQRFSVVLGIFQNSSQIVVIPNESLKWEHKGDVTSVKLW